MELTKDNLTIAEVREKLGLSLREKYKIVIQEPTYEFVTQEEQAEHYNYLKRRSPDSNKPFGLYFFYNLYGHGLLDIMEIVDLKYVNLISAFHPAFCSEVDENFTATDFEEVPLPNKYKINNEKDFMILISDYIDPHVKINIPPLESYSFASKKIYKYFTVGYLLWQTVKVLKDIYLYRKEEVVIGNIWDNLVPSCLQLYESNFGHISFDS